MSRVKETEPEKKAETAVIPQKSTGSRRGAKTPGAADKPAPKQKRASSAEAKAEVRKDTPKKAKKTAGAKSKKIPEPEKGGSKTPQVMKLVETQQLRGRAPLSRIMRREAAEIFGEYYADPNELLTVNLTELVIKENAGELLRRFNACCCDKCIDELSRRALEKIPSRFARVSRAVLEKGSPELDEQKEPLKKSALSAMIRELIGNKRRHFHNG